MTQYKKAVMLAGAIKASVQSLGIPVGNFLPAARQFRNDLGPSEAAAFRLLSLLSSHCTSAALNQNATKVFDELTVETSNARNAILCRNDNPLYKMRNLQVEITSQQELAANHVAVF